MNPFCHTATNWLTQVKALGSYTVPRVDVLVSAGFQSLPGPAVVANFVVPTAVAQQTLGRPLSGNAVVNIIEPGMPYGDPLNQLDLRFGKILRFGRTRTNV